MDKTTFETRAVSIFHDFKYVFYDELQQGNTFKQLPVGQKATLLAAGALVGLGAFAINFSNATNEEVKTEVAKLGTHCDLIGVHISTIVQLALFIHSDDLADDAAIGKCSLIWDKLPSFKKFSMRIGYAKLPVTANVFFVFGNSEKAFHFRQSVQEHCKHYSFFTSNCFVLPWGIDLSAKNVWAYKGLPPPQLKPTAIEAKLFSQ
jgi:hypothetical protein